MSQFAIRLPTASIAGSAYAAARRMSATPGRGSVIALEHDCDLGLDARLHCVVQPDRLVLAPDVAIEDDAVVRLIDTELLLYCLRREADLAAGEPLARLDSQLGVDPLNRVKQQRRCHRVRAGRAPAGRGYACSMPRAGRRRPLQSGSVKSSSFSSCPRAGRTGRYPPDGSPCTLYRHASTS
jgi:hypothetical protein